MTAISTSVHLLLKVPKMQLFRLTVKYLVQQNIFNFFFFHLKKNVNPGESILCLPAAQTLFQRITLVLRIILWLLAMTILRENCSPA